MAEDAFCYLNTDLLLTSVDDLTALATEFKAHGIWPCYVTKEENRIRLRGQTLGIQSGAIKSDLEAYCRIRRIAKDYLVSAAP